MKTIEITVYGKRCVTADGKKHFYRYFGRLPGDQDNTTIKFTANAKEPPEVPCVLILERGGCNMGVDKYTNADGEVIRRPVLWISAWKLADHGPDDGMDDYFGE